MAGYPYYPNYMQYQPQYQVPQAASPQQQGSGMIWVQGEAGAKSYLVGAGQSVLLMDSENSSFYIKSTDNSGMPMPLRVFDYTERTQQHATSAPAAPAVDMTAYVTHDELRKWTEELRASIAKEADNGTKSAF